MKIAFVYDAVYPFVVGGGEKRNWEIARRLAKLGHDVYIIGMRYWNKPKVILKENVKIIGICPAIPLYNIAQKRSLFEPFYFGFFVFLHLLINTYDIIDCGNFPYVSVISAKLATLFKKSKLIVTWHEVMGKEQWLNYMGILGIVSWVIEKIVSKMSAYNIFVSDFMLERAIKFLKMKKNNSIVIYNGIEYKKLYLQQ